MKQFYTVKFIDVIKKMAASFDFFNVFIKLKTRFKSGKFVRVILQFNDVMADCKVICQKIKAINHLLLEKSFQENYMSFINEFARFLVFFLKYSLYYKLQVHDRLKLGKSNIVQLFCQLFLISRI